MNNEIIKKFSPIIDNALFGSCLLDEERELERIKKEFKNKNYKPNKNDIKSLIEIVESRDEKIEKLKEKMRLYKEFVDEEREFLKKCIEDKIV